MNRFTNTKNKRAALKTFGVVVVFFTILHVIIFMPKVAASLGLLAFFGIFVGVIFTVFKAEDKLP